MVSKASISKEIPFSLQNSSDNEKKNVFSTFQGAQKVEKVYFYTCFIATVWFWCSNLHSRCGSVGKWVHFGSLLGRERMRRHFLNEIVTFAACGSPEAFWWLLAAPGGSWRLLAAPGGSWLLLALPGAPFWLLAAVWRAFLKKCVSRCGLRSVWYRI